MIFYNLAYLVCFFLHFTIQCVIINLPLLEPVEPIPVSLNSQEDMLGYILQMELVEQVYINKTKKKLSLLTISNSSII